MERTQYVLSLSYGKDSMACLEAIRLLGLPLDRIITADVWATDTIPAELPPMVEFKEKADRIIKERYGITVEHTCAMRERESNLITKNCFIKNSRQGGMSEGSTDSQCGELPGATHSSKCKPSEQCKLTYEHMFYLQRKRRKGNEAYEGKPTGFPLVKGPWCKKLKVQALTQLAFH